MVSKLVNVIIIMVSKLYNYNVINYNGKYIVIIIMVSK